MRKLLTLGCFVLLLLVVPAVLGGGLESFFQKSLHYTGEGMRYWYEEQGGFMEITHIPYNQLGCKHCHAKTCDTCHAEERDGKMYFSRGKARDMQTCLTCHTREKLGIKFDQDAKTPDVHFAVGMGCSDCHHTQEVHGDGLSYHSMRDPGAMKVSCLECHKEGGQAAFDDTITPHTVHKGKLDCNACHIRSTMACYNCHFSTFLKTKKKEGNFIPMKEWLLLINYEGQITSGTAMTLVHKKETFIAYAPYRTHSVMAKGRNCEECHNNDAMRLIKNGQKVPVVQFKDGKVIPWKGIVPIVPEYLSWVFLDKQDNEWVCLKEAGPKVQFAAYGTPLTEKQLKHLMVSHREQTN